LACAINSPTLFSGEVVGTTRSWFDRPKPETGVNSLAS